MPNLIRNNLVIELHVPDFGKAREFYGALGFLPAFDYPPDEKERGYLVLKRKSELGDTLINFFCGDERVYEQSFFKQFPKDTVRGYAVEITIPVKDVRAEYEKAKRALPAFIVRELKESNDNQMRWLDFRMVDPFGYYLRLTELLDWGQ